MTNDLLEFLQADEKLAAHVTLADANNLLSLVHRIPEPLRVLIRDYFEVWDALHTAKMILDGKNYICGRWMNKALDTYEVHRELLDGVK